MLITAQALAARVRRGASWGPNFGNKSASTRFWGLEVEVEVEVGVDVAVKVATVEVEVEVEDQAAVEVAAEDAVEVAVAVEVELEVGLKLQLMLQLRSQLMFKLRLDKLQLRSQLQVLCSWIYALVMLCMINVCCILFLRLHAACWLISRLLKFKILWLCL